jgi:hypothetical protein
MEYPTKTTVGGRIRKLITGFPTFTPVDRSKTFSAEDFSYHQAKGAAERSGVNPAEAGPITAFTSDTEIAQRAAKLSHAWAVPVALVAALFTLERRVAELESGKNPPAYPHLERR